MNILEMNKMQLEEYYNEHMQYNRAYKSKEMNFDEIQRYFDNLHRAKKIYRGSF